MRHSNSFLAFLAFVPFVALASCSSTGAAPRAAVAGAQEDWHIRGTLADACQCTVFCPCEFKELPSRNRCDDTAILHVERGHFGDVSLDGQDVVVVAQSPEGQRMVDTVGNLTFARIYVSKRASDAQASALAEVARRVLGTWVKDVSRISPDEKVQRVDLDARGSAGKWEARIPGVLELGIEPLVGGDGKEPVRIHNSPWSAPGIGDVAIAHSTTYRYTAEGRDWSYAGRSAAVRELDIGGTLHE